MEIKPEFEVEVAGSPLPGKDLDRFIARVTIRAQKLDPEVKQDSRSFARIRYSLRWYGKLIDLGYIDTFYNQVVRYSGQYLSNWELTIKVNYTERG